MLQPSTTGPVRHRSSTAEPPALHMLLALSAEPRSVSYGRTQLRRALALRRPAARPEAVDHAALITSELLTNAISHGSDPGATVTLALTLRAGRLRISVRDSGRGLPRPGTGAAEQEDGRGLLLVSSVSERWGAEHPALGGTVVWAELKL